MTEPAPAVAIPRGRLARAWWSTLGFLSVGVGAVGVVVPGLPTTGFFVLAAWCFGRSSPRFERWVLDLPHIGPLVRDYRAGHGMPRRAKRTAIAMMWTAIVVSAVALRDLPLVAAAAVALGVVGTVYLLRVVPTRERVLGLDTR
jgi:uncharacterized membrane protein YbaN (DUF454 family)